MVAAHVLLLLSASQATATVAPERYSLVYRPEAGETRTFSVRLAGKLGETYKSAYTITTRVTEVAANGGWTEERRFGSGMVQVGEKIEGFPAEETVVTRKYGARGEITEFDSDNEERDPFGDALLIATRYAPKAPVGMGESWTPPMEEELNRPPLKFKLLAKGGRRDAAGKDTGELLLVGEGEGPDGAKISSTIWVHPTSFEMRRAEIKISAIPTEDGKDGTLEVTIDVKNGE